MTEEKHAGGRLARGFGKALNAPTHDGLPGQVDGLIWRGYGTQSKCACTEMA